MAEPFTRLYGEVLFSGSEQHVMNPAMRAMFSPDGTLLACCGGGGELDKSLIVLNTTDWSWVHSKTAQRWTASHAPGNERNWSTLCFSPDGKYLAQNYSGTGVQVFDVNDNFAQIASMSVRGAPAVIKYTNDGRFILIGSRDYDAGGTPPYLGFRVFDAEADYKKVPLFDPHFLELSGMALDPLGKYLGLRSGHTFHDSQIRNMDYDDYAPPGQYYEVANDSLRNSIDDENYDVALVEDSVEAGGGPASYQSQGVGVWKEIKTPYTWQKLYELPEIVNWPIAFHPSGSEFYQGRSDELVRKLSLSDIGYEIEESVSLNSTLFLSCSPNEVWLGAGGNDNIGLGNRHTGDDSDKVVFSIDNETDRAARVLSIDFSFDSEKFAVARQNGDVFVYDFTVPLSVHRYGKGNVVLRG